MAKISPEKLALALRANLKRRKQAAPSSARNPAGSPEPDSLPDGAVPRPESSPEN
jgi:hypothetical protein